MLLLGTGGAKRLYHFWQPMWHAVLPLYYLLYNNLNLWAFYVLFSFVDHKLIMICKIIAIMQLAWHYPQPVPMELHSIAIPSIAASLPYLIRARQCLVMHTIGRMKGDPKRE